jgi:hypothetical protein
MAIIFIFVTCDMAQKWAVPDTQSVPTLLSRCLHLIIGRRERGALSVPSHAASFHPVTTCRAIGSLPGDRWNKIKGS